MSSSITSLLLGLATADSILIATSILMFGWYLQFANILVFLTCGWYFQLVRTNASFFVFGIFDFWKFKTVLIFVDLWRFYKSLSYFANNGSMATLFSTLSLLVAKCFVKVVTKGDKSSPSTYETYLFVSETVFWFINLYFKPALILQFQQAPPWTFRYVDFQLSYLCRPPKHTHTPQCCPWHLDRQ